MFTNIGKKIKGLTVFIMVIEMIAAIVAGMVMMILDDDWILSGLGIIIAGCIVAWLSSLVLYGFGQLVDNSDKLVNMANSVYYTPQQISSSKQSSDVLEKWLADGLITQEEYNAKKAAEKETVDGQ